MVLNHRMFQLMEKQNTVAKNTTATATTASNRTDPQNFGPDSDSVNIAAAWQGLYWILGARVDRWDISDNGELFAIGLTFPTDYVPSTDEVVHDVSYHGDKHISRSLDFLPFYPVFNGDEPTRFEDAASLTLWMSKFTRSANEGESNRSPEYVKVGIRRYKAENGLSSHVGRPASKVAIESLADLPADVLGRLSQADRERLAATLLSITPTIEEVTANA